MALSIPVLPCRVRAIYSWAKEDPHDLGFVEGDYIDVISTGDGDWWKGKLRRNKLVGYFPRNYVEYCNKSQPTTMHPDAVAQLAIPGHREDDFQKSTQEILADITMEMKGVEKEHYNQLLRYEYTAQEHQQQEEQAPPPLPPHLVHSGHTIESQISTDEDCPYFNGHKTRIETAVGTHGDTLITEQGERDLMQPLSASPLIDEVPFEPQTGISIEKNRTPAFTSNRTLSGRSQSFDLGPVTKTKGLVRKLLRGITDNKELWRSSSISDLRKEQTNIGSLKFWKQEESSSEPSRGLLYSHQQQPQQQAFPHQRDPQLNEAPHDFTTSAVTKALLDPHWMDTAQDLYRVKTLSKHEQQKRRAKLELEGTSVGDPFTVLRGYDTETYDYYLENFDRVDDRIMEMDNWPQLWTPAVLASSKIGRVFSDPVDKLRGIFILCATHITYAPSLNGPDGSDSPAALSRIMQTKRANPFELAHVVKSMCDALEIPCKVVRGHFRPSNGEASLPHAWNAVSIEGEWYLMDTSVASFTFPGASENEINTFYFLTPPTKMIFTHIPNDPSDQFLEKAIPTSVAVNLPVAAPGAFRDRVTFVDYWNGLTILNDLEPCELVLTLPGDSLDIVAQVQYPDQDSFLSASLSSSVQNKPSNMLAISQPFWQDTSRLFRVKAVLPEGVRKGTLQIYTIERHLTRRTISNMVLAYSLSINHRGSNAPFEFVSRFAHPRAASQDIYICEPQCRTLKGGQDYKFTINSHPSKGTTAGSGLTPVRIAIQSPSGRITKLASSHQDGQLVWKAQIRTLEVGCWRGVVRDSTQEGWTPFSEWYCT